MQIFEVCLRNGFKASIQGYAVILQKYPSCVCDLFLNISYHFFTWNKVKIKNIYLDI